MVKYNIVNHSGRGLYFLFYVLTVHFFVSFLSAQGVQADKKNEIKPAEALVQGQPSDDAVTSGGESQAGAEATEQTENEGVEPPKESIPEQKKSVSAMTEKEKEVVEQFQWTPEDPSFLYETRFIPGHSEKDEFLSKEVEKEVIVERIEEEKNFRKSLGKLKFNLPDWKQSSLVIIIVILFLIYRTRVKSNSRKL